MNKIISIGYPMEYEDDKHIVRTGLWLKEYEVELLEKKLQENKQLKKQKDDVVEYIKETKLIDYDNDEVDMLKDTYIGQDLLRMLGEIE